jgi:hypothetical protein
MDRQGSLIVEARDNDHRYLRLRDSEEPVEDHPGFLPRIVALEMARQAFAFLKHTALGDDLAALRFITLASRITGRGIQGV